MAIVKALTKAAKAAKRAKKKKITEGTAKSAAGARKTKPRKVKEAEGARKDPITGGSARTARQVDAGMSGRVNVGKKSDPTKPSITEMLSKSAKERINLAAAIERKKTKGTATKTELAFLTRHYKQEAADLDRRNLRISEGVRASNRKKKEVDNFAVALRKAKETGELGKEFEQLTKKQQDAIVRSAQLTQKLKDPDEVAKKMLEKRNPKDKDIKMGKVILGTIKKDMAKGGLVNGKQRMGATDYRKSGCTISSVDRRKKK